MKIRLKFEDRELTAVLNDSQSAREFLALLPLTITLEDYAGTEKISYLASRLSTSGAPRGSDPAVGDIAYYAPWGNLAIFYRDAGYASGLVILGKLDDVQRISVDGSLNVTIERMD